MLEEAIKSVKEFLNDDSLIIDEFAETDDYYFFSYKFISGETDIDNTIIKYNKKTKIVSYYMVSINISEIKHLEFKKIME